MKPIAEVAAQLGVPTQHLRPYGVDKAKIHLDALSEPRTRAAEPRLILVSAITPTKAGEGKTTTTIGLGDALARLGHSVCIALREPSLGPCMGVKGGGTGGGESRLVPSDDINLHFTGDFHAITSAHNLLAAAIDNHLHFESDHLDIEPRKVLWRRVLDMNDRALRNMVLGLGGKAHGQPRQAGFDITAASEIMAMLCLTTGAEDLRARIDRTLVAFNRKGAPIFAKQIGVTGAMLALLRDALHPNLVQTKHGTPAIVHGGPFANIAHGCNSVVATRTALHHADWVVTEAGFGFDLGAEKFYDIKCRSAGLNTAAVVLVASVRALKLHGHHDGAPDAPDAAAVKRGLPNLEKHIESIRHFGETPVVALNTFATDTPEEIAVVREYCEQHSVPFAAADHFTRGPDGACDLAAMVVKHAEKTATDFVPTYALTDSVPDKIRKVAQLIYGARDIAFTKAAQRELAEVERLGFSNLPVCIAKTQSSLSDDPKLAGRPREFEVTVRSVQVNSGAGFLVILTGDILRMPGLPRAPQAEAIDLIDGEIVNLR